MIKLDIGYGKKKEDGFIGIDQVYIKGHTDFVRNLENEYLPFSNDSVDLIRASHILEHLRNLIPLMNDCWRALKSNGIFEIRVLTGINRFVLRDPTHTRFFTDQIFEYFTKGHRRFDKYAELYGILPWKIIEKEIDFNEELYITLQPIKDNISINTKKIPEKNIKLSIGCDSKNEDLTGEYINKEGKPEMPDLSTFIGLDYRDRDQEIVADIRKGIPLSDNSCEFVWASHILEHIDAYDIEYVMDELWRIIEPGGTLEIRSPEQRSSTAHLPTHKQVFTKDYFYYFTSSEVKNYNHKQWKIISSKVYHRKGTKYDIQVIMEPVGKN